MFSSDLPVKVHPQVFKLCWSSKGPYEFHDKECNQMHIFIIQKLKLLVEKHPFKVHYISICLIYMML